METHATVILKPGEADRVLAGHPWIYKGSILRLTRPAADGEVVQVKDHRQRFLGTGLFNSKSKIHVRVLDRERVEINASFFEQRLREALAFRQKCLPAATSFRVVNAEGDFLSGLIIDKYEDAAVLQISSLGMDARKTMIKEALQKVLSPRFIHERNDLASRRFEGLENNSRPAGDTPVPLADSPPPPEPAASPPEPESSAASLHVTVNLNGLRFEVDLQEGHKTGLYLDQQVNYQAVCQWAPGAKVLDCFCFLGGFSLHLARAGAASVHGIDQSAEAIAASTRHAQANGLSSQCAFETANVFDWLKSRTAVQPHEKVIPQFDLIILDPPSFTRNRASVPDALRGYKEIHLRAFKLLKPGGVVATFCCSHHVGGALFQDVIQEAAFDARRVLRRLAVYSQSPDHPIITSIPETEYLKGFAFQVLK